MTRRYIYEEHRSWWALSHTSAVDRALDKAYFVDQGLVSIRQEWNGLRNRHAVAPAQLQLGLG